jgi:hypothetical protein
MVSASCTGSSVRLVSATPADGYRVEVGSRGPGEVEVTFQRADESSQTQVKAVCSSGSPRFSTEVEREDRSVSDTRPTSSVPDG